MPKMVLLLLAKVADKVLFVVVCCSADLTEYYRRDIVFYQLFLYT